MKKTNSVFWGFVLIAIGISFFGQYFWGWSFNLWDWWALAIFLPCLANLLNKGISVGNLLGMILGIIFLPPVRKVLNYEILGRLIAPAVLIAIGMVLVWKGIFQKNLDKRLKRERETEQNMDDEREYTASFGTNRMVYPNDVFEGCEITVNFGTIVLDLRNAIITRDVVINSTVTFGGAEVSLPSGVNLEISGTPIFGGIRDKRKKAVNPNAPTVYVNATCLFGGMDIL